MILVETNRKPLVGKAVNYLEWGLVGSKDDIVARGERINSSEIETEYPFINSQAGTGLSMCSGSHSRMLRLRPRDCALQHMGYTERIGVLEKQLT